MSWFGTYPIASEHDCGVDAAPRAPPVLLVPAVLILKRGRRLTTIHDILQPLSDSRRHLTIVHADHRPQRISGQFDAFLKLAQALPDSFIIYNGPECGASAPDHLHFQSCSRAIFPIERDLHEGFIPRVFTVHDSDRGRLVARLENLLTALARVSNAV
jgi:hypothetical protein